MFLKVVGIVITIIIGIFSILLLIGWAAGRNDPQVPGFEGIGPEDAEERVRKYKTTCYICQKAMKSNCILASNSNFELPTVNYFLAAAVSGVMPGGEKTAMPLFPKEDMVHFSTKYVDWAPEPFSKLPPQATAFGSVPGDSPAPIIRIMQIMSGLDDIFNMTMNPVTIERSFKSMKSKVRLIFKTSHKAKLSPVRFGVELCRCQMRDGVPRVWISKITLKKLWLRFSKSSMSLNICAGQRFKGNFVIPTIRYGPKSISSKTLSTHSTGHVATQHLSGV